MKPVHLAFMMALSSAAACGRRVPMVRTDPDPILARLHLSSSIHDVVWTAEPVVREGCIPAHDSPTRIHAFIAGYAGEGTPGRMDVPLLIANEILPASLRAKGIVNGDAIRIEGGTPNKNELERPEKAQVRQAVITPEGLVLELWVR
jgi:hypothetical protein